MYIGTPHRKLSVSSVHVFTRRKDRDLFGYPLDPILAVVICCTRSISYRSRTAKINHVRKSRAEQIPRGKHFHRICRYARDPSSPQHLDRETRF